MPLEGTQLGKYRLVRLIGGGGMGDVYLGEDAHLNRQVAIKVVRSEGAAYPNEHASKDAIRLFQREMRAIAQLDHPHILPLYDYGEETLHTTTLVYMVMPFRHEGSLVDWLRQRGSTEPLPLKDAAFLVSQATDALQHAHEQHIVHQDVKPSNFLVRQKKDAARLPDLLLADFGIARISSMTSSMSHVSRGTPTYMAPEQWNGDPVTATDQYALAIMAYELLTGSPPFRGRPEQLMYQHFHTSPPTPSSLQPGLPASIDAVLLRALAKKPEERFASIAEFAGALDEALSGRGDLFATLAISEGEAARGTQRELLLPGGRKVEVTIPQGASDGQRLRIEGLGDPYYSGGPVGALILTLTIFVQDESSKTLEESDTEQTVLSTSSSPQVNEPAGEESSSFSPAGEQGVLADLVPPALQGDKSPTPSLEDEPASPSPSIHEANGHDKVNPTEKTKEQWLAEGDQLNSTGRYQEALVAYEQGLQLDPNDASLQSKYHAARDHHTNLSIAASKQREKLLGIKIALAFAIVSLWLVINGIARWDVTVLSVSTICVIVVCFVIFLAGTSPS
jgi:eukaryotic-like serine/threonine-protein kinase